MALTDVGKNKIANKITEIFSHGEYKKNGTVVSVPIYSVTASGDTVTVLFNLDHTVTGKITNFKLMDTDGDVFDERIMNVTKSNDGIFPSFHYKVAELIV